MSFGETLRELLDKTNIKSVNLSSALDYDVSYISKWLNGAKLPSKKNAASVCRRIAAYLSKNASPRAIEKLCRDYNLKIGPGTDGVQQRLEDALTIILKDSLTEKSTEARTSNPLPLGEGNCTMLRNAEEILILSVEAIARHFARTSDENSLLEVICMLPLSGPFSSYRQFFRLLDERQANHPARMRLNWLLREADLLENPVLYCRCISTVLETPDKVHAAFYTLSAASPAAPEIMVIKNSLLTIKLPGFFDGRNSAIASLHPQLIWDSYQQADRYLQQIATPVLRSPADDLIHNRHFRAFLMEDTFFCILRHMQLFQLPKALWDSVEKQCAEGGGCPLIHHMRHMCTHSQVHTILYKSALISYIFEGDIHLFNLPISLSSAERRHHLLYLAEQLEDNPAFSLLVLEDENPFLPADELFCSLFFSSDNLFTLCITEDGSVRSNSFSSSLLNQAFCTTFQNIQKDGQRFFMERSALVSLLRRGAEAVTDAS